MNTKSHSESYAAAGVDITAGYKAVELMKKHIATTMTSMPYTIAPKAKDKDIVHSCESRQATHKDT